MDWLIPSAYAQAAGGSQPNALMQLLPLVLIFVVFYFLLIRPQPKRAKEHKAMVAALAAGDEVVTGGGILGKVTEVGDQFLTVEIADGVQVKVQRHTVAHVLPKGTLRAPEPPGPACIRYPAWKICLVAIVVLVALLLALPNVFGEAPALQVVAQRPHGLRRAGQTRGRRHRWRPRASPSTRAYLEGDRLVLRFATSTSSCEARDAIMRGAAGRVPRRAVAGRRARPAWMRSARPQAHAPRPRPARRRPLPLRGGRKGAVKQLLAEHGARLPARCCATSASRSPASQATAPTRCASCCAAARTSTARRTLLRKQDPNVDARPPTCSARAARSRSTLRARADQAAPGLRDPAEHHDAAQPRRRTGRDRADRAAAGRRPHRRAAARRAGSERGAARARRHRHARVPARRRPERRARGRAHRPRAARLEALPRPRRPARCCSSATSSSPASSSSTRARASTRASRPCTSSSTPAAPREMLETTRENLGKPMAVVFIEKKRVQTTSPATACGRVRECTEEEVISVATIRGVFSSNFQITGADGQRGPRARAAAARRLARRAALHRRAAHHRPEPRPGQHRARLPRAAHRPGRHVRRS